MATYAEKLKDPRWQKKRLEILNKAGFSCQNCGDSKEELSVHHRYYKKGANPWDYEWDELAVMCKSCHEAWHNAKSILDKAIGSLSDATQLERLVGYVLAMGHDAFPGDLSSPDSILGYADHFRTSRAAVLYLMRQANLDGCPLIPGPILARMAEE